MNYDSTNLNKMSEQEEGLYQLLINEKHQPALAGHLAGDTVLRAWLSTPKTIALALLGFKKKSLTVRDLIRIANRDQTELQGKVLGEATKPKRPDPNRQQRRAYQKHMAQLFKQLKKTRT